MTSTSHPSVTVVSGPEAGAVLLIDELLNHFSVGSDEGCHLVLGAFHISPMHADLLLDEEGRVIVTDTKSLAGVFVNGTQVQEHLLSDGDEISIGPPDDPESVRLRFARPDGPTAEPTALDLSPSLDLGSPELLPEAPFAFPSTPTVDEAPSLAEVELSPLPESSDLAPLEPLPDALPLMSQELSPLEPLPSNQLAEPFPVEELLPPEPFLEPVPRPALAPAPVPKAISRKPAQKRIEHDDADDPLAGLAESLGGHSSGDDFVPPPPVLPEPVASGTKAAKPTTGTSAAVKVARVSVVAALIIGLSWFGYEKYAESLAIAVVDTYLPNPVEPGQNVTINGSGFGSDPDPTVVTVKLGDIEAEVLDANPTRINIKVPELLGAIGTQTLSLRVTALGKTSLGRLLKIQVTPKVASLNPRVGLSGDEITLAGQWLSTSNHKPSVLVAGTESEILEASATRIRFKVPEVAATEGQKVSVRVVVGADSSKEAPLNFGRLPFVETVQPERALPGEVITLTGLGFSGADLAVTIGGRRAAVLGATDSEIKVSVPGLRIADTAGSRDLRVQVSGKESIAHPVELLRESAALFSPRFFVDTLEGGRVAVSCELGPVMVLAADAASIKRAHDAAGRLNTLSTDGRTARVQFSANEASINAQGGPVLAVGPADGAGNPRVMASVWAAQLTDMFDLFLQGRRPGRAVEVSTDGRVFVDMFSAARRRSAEPGVPQGVLYSPDPAWLRSLALLASNPTMGSGQALALLDGYWAGVIEVPGAIQPRKIEISLTATPSGLVGQRTSRQGRLSTDVTLQGLTYARRELRFSFTDSGDTLNFAGRLDGDVIEGEVTKASGGRVGKLTLKLTR